MSDSNNDEVLSREVIIGAKLDENGVALRAKSRAVAALDRLFGSLFDIPAAFSEGVARKKRLKDEIEERLRLAQADLAEQRLRGLPNGGDLLLRDLLEEKARKQINTAAVAVETIDALKALPPPAGEDPAAANESEVEEGVDDDWMNQFSRFAEDASSDDLRQIWGRVLAGEIRKAGSFSRHTLRFIAELDKQTAANCEFAAQRLVGSFIPKTDEWANGEALMVGLDLQRLGLLEGIGHGPQRTAKVDANGVAGITGRTKALLIEGEPDTKLSWDVLLLTRMGEEVFSLLQTPRESELLRSLADKLNKAGLKKISLGSFSRMSDGFRIHDTELVWEAEQPA